MRILVEFHYTYFCREHMSMEVSTEPLLYVVAPVRSRYHMWWRQYVQHTLRLDASSLPCRRGTSARKTVRQRMAEISTLTDCVMIVRLIAAADDGGDADAVMTRTCALYAASLPTDRELQTLSLLQQEACGTKGIAEYAVNALWSSALCTVMEAERAAPASPTLSLPPCGVLLQRRAASFP